MSSPFIALLRFFAFVAWTLLAMGPYLVLLACGWKRYSVYARGYFRLVCRLIGFHVVARGAPVSTARPTLFVANHASYLDIIVLGSLLDACFVAKAEVAGWPGFGFLARIARTLFAVAQATGPEGQLLPVQPVSVAYTRLDGRALGRALRPFYAWYGDMTLAGHLFAALGLGQLTVEVIFHPVVSLADFSDRKALSHHCHDVVSHGVVAALAGRVDESHIRSRRPRQAQAAEYQAAE